MFLYKRQNIAGESNFRLIERFFRRSISSQTDFSFWPNWLVSSEVERANRRNKKFVYVCVRLWLKNQSKKSARILCLKMKAKIEANNA
jgi:hypothetical protein